MEESFTPHDAGCNALDLDEEWDINQSILKVEFYERESKRMDENAKVVDEFLSRVVGQQFERD